MKFTKEEIKTAIAVINSQGQNEDDMISIKYLKDYLNSLLKPETKKIIVEIEVSGGSQVMFLNGIENALRDKYYNAAIKVTELPEVFTREDMEDFARYRNYLVGKTEGFFNKWISERKSK